MATLQEIITDWTFENGRGGQSVMYFDGIGGEAIIRPAIDQLFTDFAARLDSLTTWTVRTSGDELDDATGTLVGEWSDATAATGAGSASGEPVANAAMALLRWNTGQIVAGRRLKGRTFVPGLSNLAMAGGQLSSAAQTDIQDAQTAFLATSGVDMVVWHRPTGGSGGVSFPVLTGTAWNELATQRRRR